MEHVIFNAETGEVTTIPFSAEEIAATQSVSALKAYAAAKRYAVETGGITVAGKSILTDRASQSMIAGAKALVDADPTAIIDFKLASEWIQIDATALNAIALAVGRHVQACFSAEKAIHSAIEARSITTTAEIEGYAWPT